MTEEEYYQAVYKGLTNYCRSTNNNFIAPSRAEVSECYLKGVRVQTALKNIIEEWYTDGK
jgi:hypothetical protein